MGLSPPFKTLARAVNKHVHPALANFMKTFDQSSRDAAASSKSKSKPSAPSVSKTGAARLSRESSLAVSTVTVLESWAGALTTLDRMHKSSLKASLTSEHKMKAFKFTDQPQTPKSVQVKGEPASPLRTSQQRLRSSVPSPLRRHESVIPRASAHSRPRARTHDDIEPSAMEVEDAPDVPRRMDEIEDDEE